jgi:bifunctional DNA primase/polymerase-like protein
MSQRNLTLDAIRVHGWRAVLLRARSKKPLGKTWEITSDVHRVAAHLDKGGNLGLLTHATTNLAVLDADNLPVWADMVEALGQPSTAWVETGRARLHYYVRWMEDLPPKLTWKGEPVGEIQRGPGRQMIVCPPSVHPDTGIRYRWLCDPVYQLLELLPGEWRAFLRSFTYSASHDRG